MSKYTWVITAYHLCMDNEAKSFVGLMGPRDGFLNAPDEVKNHPTAKVFRMKDDDGEVYCEGVIAGEFGGFEPLDDWGTGGLGATDIQYKKGNAWETL